MLADVFNSTIDAGIFPNAWKEAIAVPVHKKGNYINISNYRPIALLPLISKVFEKLINTQICNHLNDSLLVNAAQHGFRKLRSCESALLQLSKTLFASRIAGLWTCLVTSDYSKAFDTLDHDFILHAARYCGFNEMTVNWLRSYLSGR